MKRPMTLVGGILGTVANAIFAVMYVLAFSIIIEFAGSVGFATVLVVALLELAVVLVGLILSILSIVAWAKAAEAFKKKKAIIITAAVFNILGAILGFIAGTAFYIVLALVLVATAVLFIVDVCLEGKRAAKAAAVENTEEA